MQDVWFENFLSEHAAGLYRYALWMTGNAQDAEDAQQNAMLRAWRKRETLNDKRAVKSWCYRILHREVLRTFENNSKRRDDVPFPESLRSVDSDTAERLFIESTIRRLPDKYREVLVLKSVGGFSTAETARILKISENNVLVRVHRARRLLEHELGQS